MPGPGDDASSQTSSSSAEDRGFSVAMEGNSSPSESDSYDDESRLANEIYQANILHLEASEDDGSSDSESEDVVHYSFPQFMRLPVELRRQVWEAFCPDVVQPGRVFRFMVSRLPRSGPMMVWEHPQLDKQLEPTRALLAVHHESRELALKALPDTLAIREGRKIIHFNKETDVALFNQYDRGFGGMSLAEDLAIPGFSEHIKYIALQTFDFNSCLAHGFEEEPLFWTSLETVFFALEDSECQTRQLWWCPSKSATQYLIQDVEEDTIFNLTFDIMYCWPNFKDHPDFTVDRIPRSDVLASAMEVSAEFGETLSFAEIDEEANRQGVSIWPMIIFEGDKAMNRFHALALMDETQEYVDSDEGHTDASDQEPGTDLDEYESDGIDDDDINEYSSGDDDEDDLAVLPMSDDLSTAGDFSPSGEHAIEGADAGLNAYPQAQFSSPEAESDTARDIDSSDSDEAPARAPKRRKRRAVASSSEDDSGEDVPRKRARTGSRRAAIVSDEDDDRNSVDDVANPPRAQKQTSEEGSDSDSDDEPVPSRPMSLAERLQLNRIQNPVSGSDDESSSSAVPSIRDYGDFQDDDQSVDTGDPGSEEEALSEDALIDGQAEESDDDGW